MISARAGLATQSTSAATITRKRASIFHCHTLQVSDGRSACSFQFGRTSTRLPTHWPHRIRGVKLGTVVARQEAGHVKQRFMPAIRLRQETSKLRTPRSRMLPSVVGGPGGCFRLGGHFRIRPRSGRPIVLGGPLVAAGQQPHFQCGPSCGPGGTPQAKGAFRPLVNLMILLAPRAGFEPATNRLTAGCSTTELPGNAHHRRL